MCWISVQSESLTMSWSLTWRRVSTAQRSWRNAPGTSTHLKKPAAFSSRYNISILQDILDKYINRWSIMWLACWFVSLSTNVLTVSVHSVCRMDVAEVRPARYKRHPVRRGVRQAHLWIHGPLPEWPDHPAQSRSVLPLSHTDYRWVIPDYTADFSLASLYPLMTMMWHFWCGPGRPFNLFISLIAFSNVLTPFQNTLGFFSVVFQITSRILWEQIMTWSSDNGKRKHTRKISVDVICTGQFSVCPTFSDLQNLNSELSFWAIAEKEIRTSFFPVRNKDS